MLPVGSVQVWSEPDRNFPEIRLLALGLISILQLAVVRCFDLGQLDVKQIFGASQVLSVIDLYKHSRYRMDF